MKNLLYSVFAIITAVIGYHIHHSGFWAVVDFLFAPLTWLKWLIFQQVTVSIIRDSFAFFWK